MKNILTVIILTLLFSFSAIADIEKAMDAYQAGKYQETAEILKPLGLVSASRTGAVAMTKGAEVFK